MCIKTTSGVNLFWTKGQTRQAMESKKETIYSLIKQDAGVGSGVKLQWYCHAKLH